MAKFTYLNAAVKVGTTDLSNHVESVTVDEGLKTEIAAAMGDTTEGYLGGLITAKIEITFLQDFAAALVDATLSPLIAAGGSAVAVEVAPAGETISATNPMFTMANALLQSYAPIQATSPGAVAKSKATFVPQAGSGLVRTTSGLF